MKIIAHRGLLEGPNKEKENKLDSIKKALELGFYVELDVRYEDDKFYLGHDYNQQEIEEIYLENPFFFVHCKNIDALRQLNSNTYVRSFWHQKDDYTLTTGKDIWTFPGKPVVENAFCVLPEAYEDGLEKTVLKYRDIAQGFCSDYPIKVKEILRYG